MYLVRVRKEQGVERKSVVKNPVTNIGGDVSLKKQPVGEDTPLIKDVLIERVKAENCRCAAAFLAGLPEMPLENIIVRDSSFKVKKEFEEGLEAEMCAGIPETDFRGIRVINSDVKFDNVFVDTDPMIKYEEY